MHRLGLKHLRVFFAFVIAMALGGAGLALANHDPNTVHVCVKNGNLMVATSEGDCNNGWTGITLATEDALAALEVSNEDLQSQVDALEGLIKRLHGNVAAVIERSSGGGSSGEAGGYRITLTFCETFMTDCVALETPLITEANEDTVLTFDSTTNPTEFPVIIDLLTNGVNNSLEIETDIFDADGNFAGGGSGTAPESTWFYETTQVTSGPGFVDLEGLEIGSIDLSFDFVSIFNNSDGTFTHDLDYRIFFSLAD